jgi:hypothetical protein
MQLVPFQQKGLQSGTTFWALYNKFLLKWKSDAMPPLAGTCFPFLFEFLQKHCYDLLAKNTGMVYFLSIARVHSRFCLTYAN